MNSRKRWNSIYRGDNPFGLVHTITQALDASTKQAADQELEERIKYLWVHLPEAEAYQKPDSDPDSRPLTLDELLDIVDECASVGSRSLIISIGSSFARHPHLLRMVEWAQVTHGMTVGIHLYKAALTEEDAAVLKQVDADRVRLFIDGEFMDSAHFAEAHGFRVLNADGLDDKVVSPKCELPGSMACVGPTGGMYTCGLVLGEREFRLGHFFERKLTTVMEDTSLPHAIPEGVSKAKRRCNGCPPLMARKLHDDVI